MLKVSASAGRSAAASLNGQQLSGAQYIFVSAPSSADVGSIYFYLDGKEVHLEKSAPWDMAGGTSTRANALDVSGLATGTHTVKATVKMPHETTTISGAFTIGAKTTTATVSGPTLLVSAKADRSAAAKLDGQTLAGSQHVFVGVPSSVKVSSVDFYLDGQQTAHEKSAPWDMEGGSATAASPLDISKLAAGTHTVKAVVKTSTGTTTISSTFVSGTTAAVSGPTLQVSANADRSAAAKLDGQTLAGSQHVFVGVPSSVDVKSVDFYLDGKQTAHEKSAPWDMYGGTATQANALAVSGLAAGAHTVKAVVTTSTGGVTVAGSFAVAAPVVAAPSPTPTPTPTPTPDPTPTPTPTPTLTPDPTTDPTSVFDPVSYDWSTVGGPATSTGGSISLSTNGASLSNCNIGTLHAYAENLKVNNCTINGGVFGTGSYTIEHSFITSSADGLDPTGSGYKVIQYNKIWRDGTRVGDKHQDGIQFWKGGNALVSHNWIGGFQTSAMMVKADQATISNLTIDSNYLSNSTGYYQLYLCRDSHDLRNITVTNNAFGKANSTVSTCGDHLTFVHTEEQRQAAIKAGNASAASWIVWNNNYVAGTNTVVTPPGGWLK